MKAPIDEHGNPLPTAQQLYYYNRSDGDLSLIVEPWGEEHIIPPGQRVDLVVSSNRLGTVELEQLPKSLVVYAAESSVITVLIDGKERDGINPDLPKQALSAIPKGMTLRNFGIMIGFWGSGSQSVDADHQIDDSAAQKFIYRNGTDSRLRIFVEPYCEDYFIDPDEKVDIVVSGESVGKLIELEQHSWGLSFWCPGDWDELTVWSDGEKLEPTFPKIPEGKQ